MCLRLPWRGLACKFWMLLSIDLPHYLWRSYLPLIAEHHIRPHKLLRLARKYRLFDFIASVLKTLGLKEIPGVRGHTLYILLQHSTE